MSRKASLCATIAACALGCGSVTEPPRAPGTRAEVAPPRAAVAVPPPRDDGRLPETAVPQAYRLELDLDPHATTYAGHVEIDVELTTRGRAVVLHARDLTIKKAELITFGRTVIASRVYSRAPAHETSKDELVLEFADDLAPGRAELRLDFEAEYASGLAGLYRAESADVPYLFTQFEPTDARRAFPCFDEPGFKVPVSTTLIVPQGQLAFANTPAVRQIPDGGKTRFEFAPSPPLPTYLVAFAVGPFDVEEPVGEERRVRLLAPQGKGAEGALSLRVAADHLRILERYFGSPYPYAKLDLVAVPEFAAGAMENPGLVTFREERLLVTEKDATGLRRSAALTIAHELAHMWFGDLVTMQWWDDLWLNEAFASWMANRVLDTWHPEFEASEAAVEWMAHAMWLDTLETSRTVRQPVRSRAEALEAFDGITYSKGMSILDMTEAWVGPELFQAGIQAYIREHAWKNASSRDLFDAIGAASERNVTAVFDSFTTQTGVPRVSASWECAKGGPVTIRLAQSAYRPLGNRAALDNKRWAIPVCVRYGTGESEASACTLLDRATASIQAETPACPAWLVPNAQYAGYYHSALNAQALEALADRALSNREAVGLAVDAWALVASGDLPIDDYLRFAARFAPGHRHAVWSRIETALSAIGDEMVVAEQRPAFARYVRRLVRRDAARAGWAPRPGESDEAALLRKDLLWMLGALGQDAETLRTAERLYVRWMDDSAAVPADVAGIAVRLTASHADRDQVLALRERVKNAPTSDVRVIGLSGLGAVTDPDLIPLVLSGLLDGTIRTQDQGALLWPLFSRRATREAAFAWLAQHFDALLARIPPTSMHWAVRALASHCSPEHAARVESLLESRLPELLGGERAFNQALEAGQRCVALREHAAPTLRAFLTHP